MRSASAWVRSAFGSASRCVFAPTDLAACRSSGQRFATHGSADQCRNSAWHIRRKALDDRRAAAGARARRDLGGFGAYDRPPVPLDAAILFAPVGDLVPVALEALDAAGTLAVAGIHLSDVPALDYQRHLFRERTLTSVTANTRADGDELLRLAVTAGVRPHVTRYAFDDAPRALADLAAGTVTGAAVLNSPG